MLSSAADGTSCYRRKENGLHRCCCDLAWHFLCSSPWSAVVMFLLATASSQRSQKFFQVLKNTLWIQFICFAHYLLKACIKGTIFALEEFFPSVLVTVVTPNTLYVTRGEFTKFTVKDGFRFFDSCSTPRKWDWADVVIVPGQSCRLVVVQLLLNIRRLRVWRVCRETEGSCYSRWINKSKKVWGLLQPLLAFRGGWGRCLLWNPLTAFWRG